MHVKPCSIFILNILILMINGCFIYGETISLLWVKLHNLNIASLSMESALLFCGSMRCARAVSLCDVLDSFTRARLWMPWISFNWTLYGSIRVKCHGFSYKQFIDCHWIFLNLKTNHIKGRNQCHNWICFVYWIWLYLNNMVPTKSKSS